MKNTLSLALILFFSTTLISQMTVFPDSVQVELNILHPELSVGVSSVKNDYDYEITIKWEKGNVCQGDNWLYAICDSNGCYFSSTVEKLVTLLLGEVTNMDMHFDIVDFDYAILKIAVTN